LDENTKKKIRRGELIVEILKQDDASPIPFEFQVCTLYAALHGYFDDLDTASLRGVEKNFMEHLTALHSEDVLKKIRETNEISDDTEAKLKRAIENFKNTLKK
jgi:F-type H+-transporting ATPase subunit alpha